MSNRKRLWTYTEAKYFMSSYRTEAVRSERFHLSWCTLTGSMTINSPIRKWDPRTARKYRPESRTMAFKTVGQVDLLPHVE